jgi:hypothetical protein
MTNPLQAKSISNERHNIIASNDFAFLYADCRNTNAEQIFIPLSVMKEFEPMPVIPVNLKSDVQGRDKEINIVAKHLMFLLKAYADFLKGASNNLFRVTFSGIFPCASKGTKTDVPSLFLRRYDCKLLSAVLASVFNALRDLSITRTPTRTVLAITIGNNITLDFEKRTAISTISLNSFTLAITDALRRAVKLVAPVKLFTTLRARLVNPLMLKATGTRAELSNTKTIEMLYREWLAALRANCYRLWDCLAFPQAGIGTKLTALLVRFERLTARLTNFGIFHNEPPSRLSLVCNEWGCVALGSTFSGMLIRHSLARNNYNTGGVL